MIVVIMKRGVSKNKDVPNEIWFRTFSIMLFLSAWILALISIDIFEGVAIPELIVAVAISAWVHSHILTEQMMPSRGS